MTKNLKMDIADLRFEIDTVEEECYDNKLDIRRLRNNISNIKQELREIKEIREIAEEAFNLANSP